MNRPLLLACVVFVFSACLENEEEITVHPDGSATVVVRASGDARDLDDGYAIPLCAPWQAENAATLEWLRSVGPDTGSAATRERLAALPDTSPVFEGKKRNAELVVKAEVRSLGDLPRSYASASDPYAAAYLTRSTSLASERKGARAVFTFERRIEARAWKRYDVGDRLKADLGEDVVDRIAKEKQLEPEERERVIASATAAFRASLTAFGHDALTSIYARGDAALSLAGFERARAAVERAVADIVSESAVRALADAILPLDGEDADVPKDLLPSFERSARAAVRGALSTTLTQEGLAPPAVHAVLYDLEERFAAYDHSVDLGDESFELTVHLPGRVVAAEGGEIDGGSVTWKLEGGELRDREHVLRAVSVLE